MKRLAFAAGLVLIGAAAHAATSSVGSTAIRTRDACRLHACLAVYAPGYGPHADGVAKPAPRVAGVQKDQSRFASTETSPARATRPPAPAR